MHLPIGTVRQDWRGRLLGWAGSLAVLLVTVPALAQPQNDPDWPCIQRLVPELAPAALWPRAELPPVEGDWRADPQIGRLASTLVDRDTPLENAAGLMEELVADAPPERATERLGGLFQAVLDTANAERDRMIEGIKRFARRQRDLAARITADTSRLRDLEAQATGPALGEAAEIRERRDWDTRVYDERERAMALLCEQPVFVDQRVYAAARLIAERLP
jgi:hypothetical protein